MQNIEYLADKIREENYFKMKKEKEMQYYDIIAESKISAIKLKHFAKGEGLFSHRILKLMFINFKILQWFSIVIFILYSPVLIEYLANWDIRYRELGVSYISSFTPFTIVLISICGVIIGFLGARYAKLQLQIESNRYVASHLAEEINYNLELADK